MANLEKRKTGITQMNQGRSRLSLTEKRFFLPLCPFDFKGFETMTGSREYIINFGSLPFGEHEFEYQIDSAFFKQFDNSIIQDGDVGVLVVLEKKETMLLLDFTMEGTVNVECDRCLGELILPIESYDELIVKFGEAKEDDDDDNENVILLPIKSYELDVAQYIYEFITLQMPLRNVHDEEENGQTCDPEVLKEMEKHLIKDENPPTDPRWEGLKGLNLN